MVCSCPYCTAQDSISLSLSLCGVCSIARTGCKRDPNGPNATKVFEFEFSLSLSLCIFHPSVEDSLHLNSLPVLCVFLVNTRCMTLFSLPPNQGPPVSNPRSAAVRTQHVPRILRQYPVHAHLSTPHCAPTGWTAASRTLPRPTASMDTWSPFSSLPSRSGQPQSTC